MKISELIENWQPGDWPKLKDILLAIADDAEVKVIDVPKDEG